MESDSELSIQEMKEEFDELMEEEANSNASISSISNSNTPISSISNSNTPIASISNSNTPNASISNLSVYERTIVSLESKKEEEEKLLEEALVSNPERVADILEHLETITISLNRIMKITRATVPENSPSLPPSTFSSFKPSKLPSNLPKWSPNKEATKSTCTKFLSRLEDMFNSEAFPEVEGPHNSKRWTRALLQVMVEDEERAWVRTNIVEKDLTWKKAKKAFIENFTRVKNYLAPAQELYRLKQEGNTVAIHSQRFEKHMNEALILPNGMMSATFEVAQTEPIYSYMYVKSLDKELGKKVMLDPRTEDVKDLKSLEELARKVEKEKASGSFYQNLGSSNHPNNPNNPSNNSPKNKNKRNKPLLKSFSKCSRCGRKGHNETVCHAAVHTSGRRLSSSTTTNTNPKTNSNLSTSSTARKTSSNSNKSKFAHITCHNCGQKGHYADQCTQRVNRVAVRVDKPLVAPVLILPSGESSGSSSVAATRRLAVLDTGAGTTIISLDLVKEMGMEHCINYNEKQAVEAYKGPVGSTIGAIKLKLCCGEKVIEGSFQVDECIDDVLLGRGDMEQLGMHLQNVPTSFPDDQQVREAEAAGAAQWEEETREKSSPWNLQDRIPEKEYQTLLDAIKPFLEENARLDPSVPACSSIPEATLSLPMSNSQSESKIYRRQYPVAETLMALGDDKIKEWEELGFVTDAPASSRYNTPLMAVVQKGKDPRWCMDFRHLNALIDPDDYITQEIPKVEEIFKRMAGFKYASTLDLKNAYQQM